MLTGCGATVVTTSGGRRAVVRSADANAVAASDATARTSTAMWAAGRNMALDPRIGAPATRLEPRGGETALGSGREPAQGSCSEHHVARRQVGADLALDALEGVVDGLRVAREPLGDPLVGVTVEIQRED